jgi:hypothetical protein
MKREMLCEASQKNLPAKEKSALSTTINNQQSTINL